MKDNKAFCVAPWIHFYSGEGGRVQACCVSGITYGSTENESINDLWKSDTIKKVREKFLKGEKDKRCSYCYKVESSGNQSLRQKMNSKYSGYAEKIIQGLEIPDHPVYYDIRFSNLCNLRCRTCWHGASSKWFEDAKAIGIAASDTAVIKNISASFFRNNIEEIISYAEEFYFAGGEPLVTEEVYLVLEYLLQKGKKDVLIRLNTNLTKLNFGKKKIIDLLNQFNQVELQVSLDHILEKGEYIRKDLKWSVFKKNLWEIQQQAPRVNLIIHPTISVLNVYDWPEIEDYIEKKLHIGKDHISLNFLVRPDYYCIQNLSDKSKDRIRHKYKKALNSQHLNDIETFLNVNSKNKEEQLFQRLKQIDEIRKEDYQKVLGWLIP